MESRRPSFFFAFTTFCPLFFCFFRVREGAQKFFSRARLHQEDFAAQKKEMKEKMLYAFGTKQTHVWRIEAAHRQYYPAGEHHPDVLK